MLGRSIGIASSLFVFPTHSLLRMLVLTAATDTLDLLVERPVLLGQGVSSSRPARRSPAAGDGRLARPSSGRWQRPRREQPRAPVNRLLSSCLFLSYRLSPIELCRRELR